MMNDNSIMYEDMADRKIVFYPDYVSSGMITTFKDANKAIQDKQKLIRTTQMCLLSTDLLWNGYEIVIMNDDKSCVFFRMVNGEIYCNATKKQLRMGSNLYKLWLAGEFDE